MFGELVDTARGQTIGAVTDPLGTGAQSDLANIARISTLVWCLTCGGLESAVRALAESFEVFRPGCGFAGIGQALFAGELSTLGGMAVSSLNLTLAWCGAYLMIEVLLGLCGQVVTRVGFSTSGHLLKIVITYVLLFMLSSDLLHYEVGQSPSFDLIFGRREIFG